VQEDGVVVRDVYFLHNSTDIGEKDLGEGEDGI
jgi:hypothetical protein